MTKLDSEWRVEVASLQRDLEEIRGQRDIAICERDSYRDAVRSMQGLVELRDIEKRDLQERLVRSEERLQILRKAVGQ